MTNKQNNYLTDSLVSGLSSDGILTPLNPKNSWLVQNQLKMKKDVPISCSKQRFPKWAYKKGAAGRGLIHTEMKKCPEFSNYSMDGTSVPSQNWSLDLLNIFTGGAWSQVFSDVSKLETNMIRRVREEKRGDPAQRFLMNLDP